MKSSQVLTLLHFKLMDAQDF